MHCLLVLGIVCNRSLFSFLSETEMAEEQKYSSSIHFEYVRILAGQKNLIKEEDVLVYKNVYYRLSLYVLVCACVLACTRMYSYVTRMHSYVTRMLLVCARMYSYVIRMY